MKKLKNQVSSLLIIISFFSLLTNCTLVESEDQITKEENFGYETEAVANILNVLCATS